MEQPTIDNFNTSMIVDKSPSIFKQLEFITSVNINSVVFNFANSNIDRVLSLNKLVDILNLDIETAISIEAGVFEFAIVYTIIKNLDSHFICSVYNDQMCDTVYNLESTVNPIVPRIEDGTLIPQQIPFMSADKLFPEVWEKIVDKRNLIEFKKNNMAATDMYRCKNCGESKTSVIQIQTRSADEPMTNFATCLVCKNRFTV